MTPTYSKIGGVFHVVHKRGGEVLADLICQNGVTAQGLNAMWDIAAGETINGTISQWYVGLLRRTGVNPALLWSDTWGTLITGGERYSSINSLLGWNGLQDAINFDPAAGGTTLASVVMQTVLKSTTIGALPVEGIYICNVGTTSITSGVLWCTAPVTGISNVSSGDVLTVSYTLATSAGTAA